MADEMRPGNDPDNNNNEERKSFMTQKIVGRRDSKMRTLRMIGRSMLAGVAFSLAAVVVAVIAVPRVQARFGPVVPSGETTVTLGRDESTPSAEESGPSGESGENTGADSTGESGSEGTSPAETTAPEETVPVGEIVKAEIETWPFGMPEVLKLSYGLRGVADTADLSVVTIEQVREGQDWFDNELRTSGLYSGVVIAKTDSEILILTTGNAVSGADRLVVDFGKGLKSDASVKRPDTASGLAVLTVPVTDENREKTEGVTPLELGNSYRLRRGDILIAVGAPLGMVHSADYGVIGGVSPISVTDGAATLFHTEAAGNASAGTWMLDTEGRLVGWVTDVFSDQNTKHTVVLGVSEFKAILEHMINGQASPLIGVRGSAVSQEMQEQEIPAGLYITRITRDSPAYNAGLQPGDIITRVGDTEIRTMRDYTAEVEKLHAEDSVRFVVMRTGRDENEYAELEFMLNVGAR